MNTYYEVLIAHAHCDAYDVLNIYLKFNFICGI